MFVGDILVHNGKGDFKAPNVEEFSKKNLRPSTKGSLRSQKNNWMHAQRI